MCIDCTRAGPFKATRKRDGMCRTGTDRRDRGGSRGRVLSGVVSGFIACRALSWVGV
jgi:hypothetical protein